MSNYQSYLEESLSKLRTVLDDSGTRPILFIGSGLSRRYVGAPDWVGLLTKLIEINPIIKMPIGYYTQNTNNHLPAVASALVEKYQTYAWEKYEEEIFPAELYNHSYAKSIFLKSQIAQILDKLMESFNLEDNEYYEELKILKTLNPHAVITTNYDRLLETIFDKFKVVIGQQVIKKKEATSIGHILKIHGSTEKPEEIVISAEDYDSFHEKQKYLIAKLLTYFMEHPVIFLGYSVADENIKNILADISEMVSGGSNEIVNNIWFVEWEKELIDPNFRPPVDKMIDLGQGKSIRVNYILLNSFKELYESLYQNSAMGIDKLREFESNIYNIIKSKTITDLEVDIVNVQNVTDEEALLKLIGLENNSQKATNEKMKLMGLANIENPEKLIVLFPMRISDVARKLGFSHWYPIDQAIKKIQSQTSYNIKESNNIYHIDIGINQSEHRYSNEAVEILRQVINKEDYKIVVDDNGKEIAVTNES